MVGASPLVANFSRLLFKQGKRHQKGSVSVPGRPEEERSKRSLIRPTFFSSACDTRAGRGVSKTATLGRTNYCLCGPKKQTNASNYEIGYKYPRLRRLFPGGRPFVAALSALWLSSSLLFQPLSQRWRRCCYRKRCGPRSAATSWTLLTRWWSLHV